MPAAKAKASSSLSSLVVRYPRRMKPQRVYSVRVKWKSKQKPDLAAGVEPFAVRLIMPGTQVIPTERTMDPAKPKSKAVFYVTSVARNGWLKGERLEVLHKGEKVQEIALPAKVATQRMTWILLLLAFLIPWWIINYVHITEREYLKRISVKDPWKGMVESVDNNTPWLSETVTDTLALAVDSVGLSEKDFQGAYAVVHRVVLLDEFYTESDAVYQVYLPLHIGMLLFLLALLSGFCHRERYSRKTGKPLPGSSAGD